MGRKEVKGEERERSWLGRGRGQDSSDSTSSKWVCLSITGMLTPPYLLIGNSSGLHMDMKTKAPWDKSQRPRRWALGFLGPGPAHTLLCFFGSFHVKYKIKNILSHTGLSLGVRSLHFLGPDLTVAFRKLAASQPCKPPTQITKAFNCLLTSIALDKTVSFPGRC